MENTKQEQAQNLYLMADLTQAQIAELIGVSQKTISLWFNEGKWAQLKKTVSDSPTAQLAQMANELSRLNAAIEAREPALRLPTLEEIEMRRKILMSMKLIKEQQAVGIHSEVLNNFVAYVRQKDPTDARIINNHAFSYLSNRKNKHPDPYIPSTDNNNDNNDEVQQIIDSTIFKH